MVSSRMMSGGARAVVIGASAGAVGALSMLLPRLPEDCPFPTIVVVHIPPRQPSGLVDLFASRCRQPVLEPFDKQPIVPGIWFAPRDYHLLVEVDETFAFSIGPPVQFSRPSVDVLFASAAAVYASRLVAIVLTGNGEDGSRGAEAVRAAGGFVAVQEPESAEFAIMPRAACSAARPQLVAPLERIATFMTDLAGVS